MRINPRVSTAAADDPAKSVAYRARHFAPASADGYSLQSEAASVSRAYTESYYARKENANEAVERLQYLPPGQPLDDMWSGGSIDSTMWMTNPDAIISKQCLGLTREQRRKIDGGAAAQLLPDSDVLPRFMEGTKSRSRGQSSNTVAYPVLSRGNIDFYTAGSYNPGYEIDHGIIR